ncbi:glucose-6-phosphate isomerase [Candidatus Gracilibacteria bacterium]|nr:glucose-6-phosphate isomerase [Candidatus Gracilibacteria bacterium]
MIQLDLGNLNKEKLNTLGEKLPAFLSKVENLGFVSCLDEVDLEGIINFSQSKKDKFDHLVVLGIGGSALGSKAIVQALGKELIVLDNIDPDLIKETEKKIDIRKTLFLVISKSGETIETLTQFSYFWEKLNSKDNFVFVTGEKGKLREIAAKEDIKTFSIPENVVGRFSVLTPVGLLPASLLGIDIVSLLEGAKKMRKLFLSKNLADNLPFQLAGAHVVSNKNTIVLMPYKERLRAFSSWWAQLLGESTGKQGKGFTPLPAMGVTDQHSLLQLLTEGPDDKLTMFLSVTSKEEGKLDRLLEIEKEATRKSLTESKRDNLEIKLSELSSEALGELFFLFMGVTYFLGELLGINVFDQPGVERAKVLIRESLAKS